MEPNEFTFLEIFFTIEIEPPFRRAGGQGGKKTKQN
jgi:hypothetical protein